MENVKISSPWEAYVHKLRALFEPDEDIRIIYNFENRTVKLIVRGTDKADALSRLLPMEKDFGALKLGIQVCQDSEDITMAELITRAFAGNPRYSQTVVCRPAGASNAFTYVLFKRGVVSYWNDNLGDPHGNVNTLAQELAGEIIENAEGCFFCTEPAEDVPF